MDKDINNNVNNDPVEKTNEQDDENNTVDIQYLMIPISDIANKTKDAYQNKKVTISDIDEETIFRTALLYVIQDKAQKFQVTDDYTIIPKSSVKDTIKKLYNYDYNGNIDIVYFDGDKTNIACENDNNSYCSDQFYIGFIDGYNSLYKLISKDQTDGLIIYDEAYAMKKINSDEYCYVDSYSDNKDVAVLYKDFDYKNVSYHVKCNDVINVLNYDYSVDSIKKIDSALIHKYKHIFKKNSDGSLYWVSSEPIN